MLQEYLHQASKYVKIQEISLSLAKSTQFYLSRQLSKTVLDELRAREAPLYDPVAAETPIYGSRRVDLADRKDSTVTLACEFKPLYRSATVNLHNRYNDILITPVALHRTFPQCVVGTLLVVPTWSWSQGKICSTTNSLERICRKIGKERRTSTRTDHDLPEAIGVLHFDPDSEQIVPTPGGYDFGSFLEGLTNALTQRAL